VRITPVSIILVAACSLLFGSSAHAAPETHDGFYLRLATGTGSATANRDIVEISGDGVGANVSIGVMFIENTGIFIESSNQFMDNPDLKTMGMTSGTNNAEVSIRGVGFGLVHYFMPINVYVSSAVVMDRLFVRELGFPDLETDSV
jgi:hypothetical protein